MCGYPKAGPSEFSILKLVYIESSAIFQSQFKVNLLGLSPAVGFCTWYAVILCIDVSSSFKVQQLAMQSHFFYMSKNIDFQFVQFFFLVRMKVYFQVPNILDQKSEILYFKPLVKLSYLLLKSYKISVNKVNWISTVPFV